MKRGWVVLVLALLIAAAAYWWWRMRQQARPTTSVGGLDVIQYNPPKPVLQYSPAIVPPSTVVPVTGGLDVGIPIVYWERPMFL